MHKVIFFRAQVCDFKTANKEFNKYCKAKKTRFWKRGLFNVQEAQEIKDKIKVKEQIKVKKCVNNGCVLKTKLRV